MVNLYGEVRLLDMSVMAYITRIKKTFLTDAMRYSNFIKIIIKILTNIMKKYLKKSVADWDKKKVLTLTVSKQWFDMILAGEKKEEYRAIKSYWINRLLQEKIRRKWRISQGGNAPWVWYAYKQFQAQRVA